MDNQREGFEKEIKEWYPLAECIAKERNIPICDLHPIEWSLWQQAQKQAIPEGYVLVPREPTWEMINVGENACYGDDEEICKIVYKTMIKEGEIK